jgi:hypothetical protein
MKQKKNIQGLYLWPHVSLMADLSLISSPENSESKYQNIVKQYNVLMHNIISYYFKKI